ncbi:MAG: peptide/nickel transport system permease protein [Thermoleophilaceae bacterium]|jgi:peptide/nickel transport system permease protein|nr:peptide/nickel transport system permease protein [Thermoleophilaceae bacterium]
MAFVLLAVSVLTFLIFNVIPGGDPAQRIAGRNADEATREQVRRDYGFDEPVYVQYWEVMKRAATGDLVSYTDRRNVRDEIVEGIPITASLVIGASILWLTLGVLFGVLSARYAGRLPDRFLTVLAMIGISLPVFWLGLTALYYLTYKVELFPAGGYAPLTENPLDWAWHLVLPWVVLSTLFVGFYSRLVRASVLEVENEDYVRTARAKGLPERQILLRHTLRNALIPVVTLFGLDFGALFGGGAILTESVFDLPGVGGYAAESIGSLDVPPVMGVVLYSAFFIVLLSAVVDIVYAYLDPRIRVTL